VNLRRTNNARVSTGGVPEGRAARRLFWAAVGLGVTLVAVKATFLGVPQADGASLVEYLRSLAAISYRDTVFAAGSWLIARAVLVCVRPRWARATVAFVFAACAAFVCLYAVANVVLFHTLGGFVTYPTLMLIADVRMIRSSVSAYLTTRTMAALLGLPLTYIAIVETSVRIAGALRAPRRYAAACVPIVLVWSIVGSHAFAADWPGRSDRRVADNAAWVFAASWWRTVRGDGAVRMPDEFPAEDLADFEPVGPRPSLPALLRRASRALDARAAAARRPPNVILIVLESVGGRWTSLNNPAYRTTPVLEAESAHGIVFNRFYTHIGRSSNSLVSMLLSVYPKLDFRELTEQYPDLPGTTLPAMFHNRGYRTAFVTPSDLSWAGWGSFLAGHGFDAVWDHHDLGCHDLLSSWGVEDRCMVDRMVQFVGEQRSPFFLMGWTTQTHHPYETSPGVAELDLLREHTPDDWSLGRYLNIIHETDRQLARLFDAVRAAGLAEDTLIVVTGDHGQAFGYPHDAYTQGRTVYEEDVNVPLLLWFPRGYRKSARSTNIGSLVDLAPTIADVAGFPPAADWQGRSLFDARHTRRAYFYVAESEYTLGLREGNWKYIYNLRDGTEELYDLATDPIEQHNVAALQPQQSARYRQRLAALAEANRRQYLRIGHALHSSS
jgi:arylsulfatase A-like enzyme